MLLEELRLALSGALNDKSDRACVVGACAWVDQFLQDACERRLPHGESSPKTMAARLAVAQQRKWIDADLHADLQVLRRLRNTFAHEAAADTLNDEHVEQAVNSLRIPRRLYNDWGQLAAAETVDGGVVLYTGARPDQAKGELRVGKFTFRMALTAVLALLMDQLKLEFSPEPGTPPVRFEVIDQLRNSD